jgi:hypothetical protein
MGDESQWFKTRPLGSKLALAALALGVALANFEAGIALADHVDSSTATHYLAIRVTILECTNR